MCFLGKVLFRQDRVGWVKQTHVSKALFGLRDANDFAGVKECQQVIPGLVPLVVESIFKPLGDNSMLMHGPP